MEKRGIDPALEGEERVFFRTAHNWNNFLADIDDCVNLNQTDLWHQQMKMI